MLIREIDLILKMFMERIEPYIDSNYVTLLEKIYFIDKNKPTRIGFGQRCYDIHYVPRKECFIIDFVFQKNKAYEISSKHMRKLIRSCGKDFSERMNNSIGEDEIE